MSLSLRAQELRSIGDSDRVVAVRVESDETIGDVKRKLVDHGLRTDRHSLVFELEHLEDARTVGQYKLPPNARLTVVPLVGGCPPDSCCCFGDVETGALVFTRVFNVLQALGMLAGFLGALLGALSSCRWFGRTSCPSATTKGEELLAARFISGLVISSLIFGWNALQLAVGLYGAGRIKARDPVGVKHFLYMQIALLVLTAFTNLGLTFPFYVWYVYCLSVLRDQLRREHEFGPASRELVPAGVEPPPYDAARWPTSA